jgi:hypothetical protein
MSFSLPPPYVHLCIKYQMINFKFKLHYYILLFVNITSGVSWAVHLDQSKVQSCGKLKPGIVA